MIINDINNKINVRTLITRDTTNDIDKPTTGDTAGAGAGVWFWSIVVVDGV